MFASAPPAFAQYIQVNSVWASSRQELEVTTDGPAIEGMDVRFYEFREELEPVEHLPDDQRVLVIQNMNGEIDEELPNNCRFGRLQGTDAHQNDYSTVTCLSDRTRLMNIEGTPFDDLICTIDPTNDEFRVVFDIHTLEGNDAITGGIQDDELNGGHGTDLIRGWKGPDHIYGTDFPDRNDPHPPIPRDRDYIWGEDGNDHLWGGPADDFIVGGPGQDKICGAEAEDSENAPEGGEIGVGCIDWEERDGSNTIFTSEVRDRNLDTGLPSPTAHERDEIDCGGPGFVHKNQYSDLVDVMTDCPSAANPLLHPPQHEQPYKTPAEAAAAENMRACPPIK